MPLPILKPSNVEGVTDMHYMSFEEAMAKPFTAEQQPSLKDGRRTNNKPTGGATRRGRESNMSSESEQNKTLQSKLSRGVATCKDCMNPR